MLDAGEPGQRRPPVAAPHLPLAPGQRPAAAIVITDAVLGLHGRKVEITLKTVGDTLNTVVVVTVAGGVLVPLCADPRVDLYTSVVVLLLVVGLIAVATVAVVAEAVVPSRLPLKPDAVVVIKVVAVGAVVVGGVLDADLVKVHGGMLVFLAAAIVVVTAVIVALLFWSISGLRFWQ